MGVRIIRLALEVDDSQAQTSVKGLRNSFDYLEEATDRSSKRVSSGFRSAFDDLDKEAKQSARAFKNTFNDIDREALRAARETHNSFTHYLSPSFFKSLASRGVSAFKSGLSGLASGVSSVLGGALSVAGGNLVTSVISAATEKITGGIKQGIDYNKLKQNLMFGYERKLGTKEEAASFFRQVSSFAAEESPLQIPQAHEQANRILAFKFRPDEVIPLLRAAGDTAAGLGKIGAEAQEKVEQITTALGQIRLEQKVSAEELTGQLVEAGVDAWGYVADGLKQQYPQFAKLSRERVIAEAMKLGERNLLDADAVVAAVVKGMQRDFGGLGKRINLETVSGKESNIEDRTATLLGMSTESLFETYGKRLDDIIALLQSGGAEKLAGGVSATTGGVLDAIEGTVNAIRSGNLKQLGLEAMGSAISGVNQGAQGLYDSGVKAGARLEQGVRDRLDMHSPSRVMLDLGFNAGLSFVQGFQDGAQEKSGSLREYLEKLANDPMFKAFFEAIRRAEGGAPNRIVGGSTFSDFSRHPNRVGMVTSAGPSTAAGSWQITGTNWRQLAPKLGLTDFGVNNQMLAALELFRGRGGDRALLSGDIAGAIRAAGRDWAGVPGSPLLGREITREQFMRFFNEAFAKQSGIQSVIGHAPTPQPETFGPFAPYRSAEEKDVAQSILHTIDVLNRQREQVSAAYKAAIDAAQTPERYAEATRLQKMKIASPSIVSDVQALTRDLGLALAKLDEQILAAHDRLDSVLSIWGGDGAALAPFDVSRLDITQEQAKQVLDIFSKARESTQLLSTEVGQLATTVTPKPLESIKLAAVETKDAFDNLPPLIKASGDEAKELQKQTDEVRKNVASVFGNSLDDLYSKGLGAFFKSIKQGFKDLLSDMFKEYVESSIFKLLGGGGEANASGGGDQGGFSFGSLFKGLFGVGGNQGGISVGGFGGGTYNIGGGQQSGGDILGSIKRFLGFGGGARTAASGASASGGYGNILSASQLAAIGEPPAMPGASSASAGAGAAASGINFAGLGAAGIMAGGGFLGANFIGSKDSPLSQLLGGAGGSLLAGAAIGSGLFGGSMAALMPAFLSAGPAGWIIGGALVGGALISRLFANRTEKALRSAIQGEYGLVVKDMAVLKQVKELGEQNFGKGQVRRHLLETIRLDSSKELLQNYAAQTGQSSSKLILNSQYADPNFKENQFIRRLTGGIVPFMQRGRDYVPALLDGGEYVVNAQVTAREGQDSLDALQAGRATIVPRQQAPVVAPATSSGSSSQSGSKGQSSGIPPMMMAAFTGALQQVAEAVERLDAKLKAMSPGDVVTVAADENPNAFTKGLDRGLSNNAGAREAIGRKLGLA